MKIGIIGAGSAGYVAALRAAQFGAEVDLFERKEIGGTCLNVGCIPTKALIAGVNYARQAREASTIGVNCGKISIDLNKLQDHKQGVVSANVKGIEYLLAKKKVSLHRLNAQIISPNEIEAEGERFIYSKIIIATGSRPACIPGVKIDGKYVISSDEALSLRELPKTMLVIGGGVIGLEFAGIFSSMGVQVTVVELMDRLLPQDDEECSRAAMKSAFISGLEVLTQTSVTKLFPDGGQVEAEIDNGKEKIIRRFDKALMAVGRSPNLDEMSLQRLGVDYDRRGVKTDSFMQTNVPGIYAIGDVCGGYMLAHVAYTQAKVAASHALGHDTPPMSYDAIPRVTFVNPEISACGLTSKQLDDMGIQVKWSKFMYMASGRARAQNWKEGIFKIGVDSDSIIRSAIIVGEHSGELISFFSQAMTLKTPIHDLEQVIIAHPTLAEMCVEVIEVAAGHPLHS
jgi:dihydrolipoamide dehydrogenase